MLHPEHFLARARRVRLPQGARGAGAAVRRATQHRRQRARCSRVRPLRNRQSHGLLGNMHLLGEARLQTMFNDGGKGSARPRTSPSRSACASPSRVSSSSIWRFATARCDRGGSSPRPSRSRGGRVQLRVDWFSSVAARDRPLRSMWKSDERRHLAHVREAGGRAPSRDSTRLGDALKSRWSERRRLPFGPELACNETSDRTSSSSRDRGTCDPEEAQRRRGARRRKRRRRVATRRRASGTAIDALARVFFCERRRRRVGRPRAEATRRARRGARTADTFGGPDRRESRGVEDGANEVADSVPRDASTRRSISRGSAARTAPSARRRRAQRVPEARVARARRVPDRVVARRRARARGRLEPSRRRSIVVRRSRDQRPRARARQDASGVRRGKVREVRASRRRRWRRARVPRVRLRLSRRARVSEGRRAARRERRPRPDARRRALARRVRSEGAERGADDRARRATFSARA